MSSNNWVGKILGKVQIESLLARGGMAEVYLGTHVTLHRKVAVKILRNPSEEHSDALERFQREARVVASLRHANIVQVYDFDMVDNDPFLVMEYIQGPSLSRYLHHLHQENKRLPLPQIVRMIKGIGSALQYAHKNGIVHRDIKPGNILLISPTMDIEVDKPLPDDFEPVLTDFGLIRFLDSARQTTTGVTAGTPAYMSPEQARGETTDGRTDVYSLGIVLYEMLAGKLPFDGETTMGILLKHVNEPPAPIPGLSPFMQQVIDRALSKDVNTRFQSPIEFANAFSASVDINPATMQMESLSSLGPSTIEFQSVSTGETTGNQERTKRSNWIRGAFAGIAAVAVGAFLFINGFPASAPNDPTKTTPPPSFTNTVTATNTNTSTPTLAPIILDPSVVLHFQDGNAIADQARVVAQRIPAPPSGFNYEVWLIGDNKRMSIGFLTLDENGMGELVYTDEQGDNLAALNDRSEITIEPVDDTKASSSGLVAYSYTMPADGLVSVRYLISSYANTPNKIALVQGLHNSIQKVNELAVEIQSAHGAGNEALVRQNAEAVLNLIVGSNSPSYKDWDQDGFITDESDGYGLFLNGSNPGYFQAISLETGNAVKSKDPSEPMVTYGENLKLSVQNLAQWTSQLQEMVAAVLETPEGAITQKMTADLVTIADQMLEGVDLDNNGNVDPVAGESGAQSAYQFAYSMADMPYVLVGYFGADASTSTPVVDNTILGGGGGGSAPTQHIPPGQVKTPPGQDKDKDKDTGKPPKP